ncbi:MAG: Triosephosphate isomerase [Owenweeksia sp. TMED14]|nr:MAG: Triosephosphate isomerase [Owenweeksia sp. TMED14]|tara:strand:+ start:2436 stop:3191 length:756 start_codon:yes stop_codon:yes gene_type:complete
MKFLVGNWKMNTTPEEGMALLEELSQGLTKEVVGDVRVVVAPPSLHLIPVADALLENSQIEIAAQNCHYEDFGAYTGEISAQMLLHSEVDAVILGHSERRQYFSETDDFVALKVKNAIKNHLIPIVCVGEKLEQRNTGTFLEDTWSQLSIALSDLSKDELEDVIIAYEPIWAIGTGEVASPEQVQQMHSFLRRKLKENMGRDDMPILYGGSCKPSNADEIFSQNDVDGGLIGGASLNAEDFMLLVEKLKNS